MRVWRSSVDQKQRQHGLGPEVLFSLLLHKSQNTREETYWNERKR